MKNNLEKELRKEILEINGRGKIKEFFIKSVLTIEKMLPENQKIHIGRTSADYDVIASTIGKQRTTWPKVPIELTLYCENESFYIEGKEVKYKMVGDVSPFPIAYKGSNADMPLVAIEELMKIKNKKFPLSEIYLNSRNFRKYSVEEITQDLYGAFCYCNNAIDEFINKKIEGKMRKNLRGFFENSEVLGDLTIKGEK